MESLITVFRMSEVSKEAREKIIIQLGHAINGQFGMNLTEPLVFELVSVLNPDSKILSDPHYLKHI